MEQGYFSQEKRPEAEFRTFLIGWAVLKAFPQKLLICAQLFDCEVLADVEIAAFDAVGRVLRQVEPAGQIHPFDPVGLSLAP